MNISLSLKNILSYVYYKMKKYDNFFLHDFKKNGGIRTIYSIQYINLIRNDIEKNASIYCDLLFDKSYEYTLYIDIHDCQSDDLNKMLLFIGNDQYTITDKKTSHIFEATTDVLRIQLDVSKITARNRVIINNISIKKMPNVNINIKEITYDTKTMHKDAVLLHIGNYDMWNQMNEYLMTLDMECYDLWISLVVRDTEESEIINGIRKTIYEQYPNANILSVPNRGMDIGGFFYTLKEIFNNKYTYRYILKLHTKTNMIWRDDMSICLLKPPDQIRSIMDNPCVGMIGSKKWTFYTKKVDRVNTYHMNRLIHRFNMKANIPFNFVGGTVFWVKYELLLKIYGDQIDWIMENLNDRTTYDSNWMNIFNKQKYGNVLWDDLPNRDAYRDGMFEHAMERFFGYSLYCNDQMIHQMIR